MESSVGIEPAMAILQTAALADFAMRTLVRGDGVEPPEPLRQRIYSPHRVKDPNMQPHLAFIANYYKQKSTRFTTEIFFSLVKTGITFYKSLSCSTFNWSHRQGSNLRPADYKSAALPTELRGHKQA